MSIFRRASSVLLAILLAAPLAAARPASYAEAWRWAHFTTVSGLPSNSVLDAFEIGGRFWVVTTGGIAWFDGYRWHPVAGSPDGISDSGGLVVDGKGMLATVVSGRFLVGSEHGLRDAPTPAGAQPGEWVGCARAATGVVLVVTRAGAVFEWDGSTCRRHEPSRPLGRVLTLVSARSASVWASAERGLWRWDGSSWELQLNSEGERLELGEASERANGDALIYVTRPLDWRGLWQWKLHTTPRPLPGLFSAPIVSIALAADGETVVAHNSGEVARRAGDRWESIATPDRGPLDARRVGFLANHDMWLAIDHGLYVHRRSSTRWRVQVIPRPDDRNTINDIAQVPDGRIVLATGHGILWDSGGTEPDTTKMKATEEFGAVTGIATDRRGRLWAASGYSFPGLLRLDADGRWHRPSLPAGLDKSFVHRIARDRSGSLWFLVLGPETGAAPGAENVGAYRLLPDDTAQHWSRDEGLPSARVYAFAEGPDGAYWFGTADGISRWQSGRWRHWTMADGLKSGRVFTLAVDGQGVVWFGHQLGGLGRLEIGKIRYLTQADGLATDRVWCVQVDERGRVWAGGEGGVSVLANGNWSALDARTGMISTRIWPILSRNDLVYLGTRGGGLAVLNLADRSTAPPPLVVPDKPIVDERGFSIRWAAFAWWGDIAPDAVLTRSRIDGGAWTPWSTDRELRAGLPSGTHEISLESKDVLGAVNTAIPHVAIVVPPPLFGRPAFYLPMAALALVAGGLVAMLVLRQRRHHVELHQREQQSRRTFQASPLAASITALDDGRFLDVNEAFVRLSGYAREELVGRRSDDIGISASDYDRARTAMALRAGQSLRRVELTTRRRSGERLEVLGYFEAFEYDGRPSILGQYLDVTEQRRLEVQLRQAQKMESIGRLAGGVAHDFNNLLTVIIGNAALVDAAQPAGDPLHEEIEQITIAADRAERLTRQLLAFARRQVVEPKVVNLNDLVLGTDRVLRRLIGEDIELVTIPTPDLPAVFVDPNQMEQVLWNLAVNARDAMPGGGTLTIRTSVVAAENGNGQDGREGRPSSYVRLTMSDTGVGMDGSVRSQLFEPFFTTKGPGKGTGLGLATCYGIVNQAGGQIQVESEPGRGATFHVDLPPAPASSASDEGRERQAETPGGAETVLLVEDEAQVRKLAGSVLRKRGYHVLEAENGQEGLRISSEYKGSIDLLVTDVVMPLMRGTEMAERLRAARPGLPVLFVSGYADNEAFTSETGTNRVGFLAKPFTPAALARRVREMLDEATRVG